MIRTSKIYSQQLSNMQWGIINYSCYVVHASSWHWFHRGRFLILFYFLAMPCGMWDLSSLTWNGICTPYIGSRVLTIGPPRKSQKGFLKQISFNPAAQDSAFSHLLEPPPLICCFPVFHSEVIWSLCPSYQWVHTLKKKIPLGTFLVVQWLIPHTSTAAGTSSTPVRGTKIPHAVWCSHK